MSRGRKKGEAMSFVDIAIMRMRREQTMREKYKEEIPEDPQPLLKQKEKHFDSYGITGWPDGVTLKDPYFESLKWPAEKTIQSFSFLEKVYKKVRTNAVPTKSSPKSRFNPAFSKNSSSPPVVNDESSDLEDV